MKKKTLLIIGATICIVAVALVLMLCFNPTNSQDPTAPGLYNDKGKLLASWKTLVTKYGLDCTKEYSTNTVSKETTSLSYIIKNNPQLSGATKLIIDNDVTLIGAAAFADCTTLKVVMLPASVEKIDREAFYKCSNLTSVTISEGTKEIGKEAFARCTSLADVTLPSTINQLGSLVFAGCENTITIQYNGTRSQISSMRSFSWKSSAPLLNVICTDETWEVPPRD